ncbi:hypothetical protein ABZ235_08580 [Streptomyces canus]|uniref:hypothetical protein n=1 Tax=Streptomyces canus TaxID=58343 RepID=UPI00339DDE3B
MAATATGGPEGSLTAPECSTETFVTPTSASAPRRATPSPRVVDVAPAIPHYVCTLPTSTKPDLPSA